MLLSANIRISVLVFFSMLAFAANSLLCRMALKQSKIEPEIFTLVRVSSGALTLCLLSKVRREHRSIGGSWHAAGLLSIYLICFALSYVTLAAGTGALLLFAAVELTMIAAGVMNGERLTAVRSVGACMALAGLVLLFAPGMSAPDPFGALLMVAAGVAWGGYSLLGRGRKNSSISETAGNFIRATLIIICLASCIGTSRHHFHCNMPGLIEAVIAGALASGLGYALWYSALPSLSAVNAASVQLSVPVIATLGAAMFLGEHLAWRTNLASIVVLAGIACVIRGRSR